MTSLGFAKLRRDAAKLCDTLIAAASLERLNRLPFEVTSRKLTRMNMVENAIRPASAMLRYGLAIAFVALALGLTFFLQSVVSTAGFSSSTSP